MDKEFLEHLFREKFELAEKVNQLNAEVDFPAGCKECGENWPSRFHHLTVKYMEEELKRLETIINLYFETQRNTTIEK